MSRRWPGLTGFDRTLTTLGLLLALGEVLAADDLPREPTPLATVLVPGRLPWGASALPTGELLAPCEDQSLTVYDGARELTRWTAGSRIAAPVTVAPRGPTQQLAVPEVAGRIDVLVWDSLTRTLAQSWSLDHGAEASASAWGASGTLYGAWKDGHLEARSARGEALWSAEAGFEVDQVLLDETLGLYAFGPGVALLMDHRGREAGRWALSGRPRGVLQTLSGQLFCWTDGGLWFQGASDTPFGLLDSATDILGAAVDRQDRLVVTQPFQIRRFLPDGRVISTVVLPHRAITAAVLDDRGRYLVGTSSGLEEWAYDGRFLGVLDPTPPASAPLVTDQGLALWSSVDWNLHFWTEFRLPPFGWAQDGGSQGRGFSARRPTSVALRSVNWADDPEFGYLYGLASSGDENKQRRVLDQLAALAAQGPLLASKPWANLILLTIARSGLTDLLIHGTQVTNNWPGNRLRAYLLLAQTAGPEDRDELIAVLKKEFDPAVVAQGFQALARSGWDGDGRILRLLAEVQAKMPAQSVVADAVIDAARTLWAVNGRSTDPVLVPLVASVFQGPFPRTVKVKAQKFFQELVEGP